MPCLKYGFCAWLEKYAALARRDSHAREVNAKEAPAAMPPGSPSYLRGKELVASVTISDTCVRSGKMHPTLCQNRPRQAMAWETLAAYGIGPLQKNPHFRMRAKDGTLSDSRK